MPEPLPIDGSANGAAATPEEQKKAAITKDEKVRDFLRLAHKRFKTSADFEATLRELQLEDKRFRASDQWPSEIVAQRAQDKRPCLTINRLLQPLAQISDAQRQLRPGIQVNPVDDGSDPDTAEALQGIIRNIERNSDADTVYETGCNDQRVMGRGYWRILTEYADDNSFDLELRLKRIRNAFSVYMDPACQEATYSDARYAFIVEDIPTDEYKARWSKSRLASLNNFSSIGDTPQGWLPEGHIRVAEYYLVEEALETISLVKLPAFVDATGQQQPEQMLILPLSDKRIQGAEVLKSREVRRRTVKWATINAIEILDGNDDLTDGREWPATRIPIVPVIGDEIDIDGKLDYRGVVRDGKDANRLYNYQVSSLVETVGLAPKAPYIGAEGQFEGHEERWDTANVRNWSRLEYKPITVSGQLAPPPQRQNFEPAIQAIVVSIQQADNDVKTTTGWNDASLGRQGPQESGRAIMARQQQDQKGSSNYLSNFSRAVRYTGELLIELIPRVYDAPRIARIIGTDDQPKLVMLHAGQPPAESADQLKQRGIAGIYDVGAGRYDVTASVGPSYASRRQESVDVYTGVIHEAPQLLQVIGDIVFRNMDVPGAQEIAKRLQKLLPPQVQEGQPGQPEIPPQVQQQVQAMQQQIQQLTQQLQQAEMLQETEAQKLAAQGQIKQLELQSRERMELAKMQYDAQCEQIKAQTEIAKIQAQAAADERLVRLEAALQEMSARMDFQRETVRARQDTALEIGKTLATQPVTVDVVPAAGNNNGNPQE